MYGSIFQTTTIPVLEQVVNFAQARHTVLAGNIANLDTPGYRVRDLSVDDFQGRLRQAIKARHMPTSRYSYASPTRLAEANLGKIAKNPKTILRHDECNVGIEHQVTEMVKNQMQHNMALAIMTSQFRLLNVAISERV